MKQWEREKEEDAKLLLDVQRKFPSVFSWNSSRRLAHHWRSFSLTLISVDGCRTNFCFPLDMLIGLENLFITEHRTNRVRSLRCSTGERCSDCIPPILWIDWKCLMVVDTAWHRDLSFTLSNFFDYPTDVWIIDFFFDTRRQCFVSMRTGTCLSWNYRTSLATGEKRLVSVYTLPVFIDLFQ